MSRWKNYGGITAYIGQMGSGKTYLATAEATRALRAGREVWTNAGYGVVDHKTGNKSQTYVSLQEMLLAPPGTLLILDEAGTFMNARHYQELPRALMYRLTQARKTALRLIYTAQHEMQVDVALRRLTSKVYHVRRFGPVGVASAYPPVDLCKADTKTLGRHWFLLRKEVMESYDTEARVWVPPEVLDSFVNDTPNWMPLSDELMESLRIQIMEARRDALESPQLPHPEPVFRSAKESLPALPEGRNVPTSDGVSDRPGAPSQGRSLDRHEVTGAKRRPFTGGGRSVRSREGTKTAAGAHSKSLPPAGVGGAQ